MAEKAGKTMTVKAFGKKYELPGQLPFDIVLRISRRYKEGAEEMSEEDMIEMAHTLFGKDTFEDWLRNGISLDGVGVMIEGVMKMYMDSATNTADRMANAKQKSSP